MQISMEGKTGQSGLLSRPHLFGRAAWWEFRALHSQCDTSSKEEYRNSGFGGRASS